MLGSIRYSVLAAVFLVCLLVSPAGALAAGGLSGAREHPAFASLLAGSFSSPGDEEEPEPILPAESQGFQGAEEEELEEESEEEPLEGEDESGNGPGGRRPRARCVVPAVDGDSLAVARIVLRKAHCSLGKVSQPHLAHTAGSLVVVHQSRPRGKRLKRGYPVAVTLGPKAKHRLSIK